MTIINFFLFSFLFIFRWKQNGKRWLQFFFLSSRRDFPTEREGKIKQKLINIWSSIGFWQSTDFFFLFHCQTQWTHFCSFSFIYFRQIIRLENCVFRSFSFFCSHSRVHRRIHTHTQYLPLHSLLWFTISHLIIFPHFERLTFVQKSFEMGENIWQCGQLFAILEQLGQVVGDRLWRLDLLLLMRIVMENMICHHHHFHWIFLSFLFFKKNLTLPRRVHRKKRFQVEFLSKEQSFNAQEIREQWELIVFVFLINRVFLFLFLINGEREFPHFKFEKRRKMYRNLMIFLNFRDDFTELWVREDLGFRLIPKNSELDTFVA